MATKEKKYETSTRAAFVILGMLLIALGIMGGLCLARQLKGSLFDLVRNVLYGFAGSFGYGVCVVLAWLGLLVTFAAGRHVSMRLFLIVSLELLVVTGVVNLLSRVNQLQYFMDYVEQYNNTVVYRPNGGSYGSMLAGAYQICSKLGLGGGLMGMLLAWPAWKLAGVVMGTVLLGIVGIALLLLLIRFDIGKAFENLRKSSEIHSKEREQKKARALYQRQIQEQERQRLENERLRQTPAYTRQPGAVPGTPMPGMVQPPVYPQNMSPQTVPQNIPPQTAPRNIPPQTAPRNIPPQPVMPPQANAPMYEEIVPAEGQPTLWEKLRGKAKSGKKEGTPSGDEATSQNDEELMDIYRDRIHQAEAARRDLYGAPSSAEPTPADPTAAYRRPESSAENVPSSDSQDPESGFSIDENPYIVPAAHNRADHASAASKTVDKESPSATEENPVEIPRPGNNPFAATIEAQKPEENPQPAPLFHGPFESIYGASMADLQNKASKKEAPKNAPPVDNVPDETGFSLFGKIKNRANRKTTETEDSPWLQSSQSAWQRSNRDETEQSGVQGLSPKGNEPSPTGPMQQAIPQGGEAYPQMPTGNTHAAPAGPMPTVVPQGSNQPVSGGHISPAKAQQTSLFQTGTHPRMNHPTAAPNASPKPEAGLPQTPKASPPLPYTPPMEGLLAAPVRNGATDNSAEDNQKACKLEQTLESFGIPAKVVRVTHGPAVTRFELALMQSGINVRRIQGLDGNIAMDMASNGGIRIEIPIPGTNLFGIEVPNPKVESVSLAEVLFSPEMKSAKSPLTVALGKDIAGQPVLCDLAKMPHLLIAGQTGSGKSVCINTIINSIIYRASPQEVRLIMVDPKVVELQCYNGIPHLITPVISDPHKAAGALTWVVAEMLDRYHKIQSRGVREISSYNQKLGPDEEKLPRIVVIIDELSDLMMACRKEVEDSIIRIAQLARAAGIHLVLATQRPTVNVITGLIKANIPSRIAFSVASNIDSRTILDQNGAEKLLGKGDMFYFPSDAKAPLRVQGCYLSDDEIEQIVNDIKAHGESDYDPNVQEIIDKAESAGSSAPSPFDEADTTGVDPRLGEAIDLIMQAQSGSISLLQRRMSIGHGRAGRLMDQMEERGIVGPDRGSKPRKLLMTPEEYEQMKSSLFIDGNGG